MATKGAKGKGSSREKKKPAKAKSTKKRGGKSNE